MSQDKLFELASAEYIRFKVSNKQFYAFYQRFREEEALILANADSSEE